VSPRTELQAKQMLLLVLLGNFGMLEPLLKTHPSTDPACRSSSLNGKTCVLACDSTPAVLGAGHDGSEVWPVLSTYCLHNVRDYIGLQDAF